ncbi:MAG: rod shape-determining protein MreD [Neisseriaceae bacterium]|nr:rod shape-determining protein MreD [Neisseriaceae bacterium]
MNENFYSRIPLKLIIISFIVPLILDFIPFSGSIFYWLPEFTALMLYYWLINRPQNVGIGTAFVLGLLVDIGTASPLGEHALAYVLSAYLIVYYHRKIYEDDGLQAVFVGLALLLNEMVQLLVNLRFEHRSTSWGILLSPIMGAFLWPALNKLMVSILNFRQLKR